jgi:MoaA/NifB/PqqE/SkfB family radical SAM enzyme
VSTSFIAFHITDRCPLSCLHCLRDPGPKSLDLPVETLARLLDQAVAVYRAAHVALTGGEPMTHPGLAGIVAAIVSRGLRYHLVTSGVGFSRLLAIIDKDEAARCALARVNVSVDGATAATHDAIRGAGSYRHAMEAVAACQARGVEFGLQLTINALNVAELEHAALGFAELGAKRILFGMTQPTGTHADARMALPARMWRTVHERIQRLSGILSIPVVAAEGFPRTSPFHTCAPFAGEILHVDPSGRLTLCCQHSGIPGEDGEAAVDLTTASLAEGHRRLLDVMHAYQRERLVAAEAGTLGEWDLFPCNACLRRFGKPHWTEQGTGGPQARRAEGGAAGAER